MTGSKLAVFVVWLAVSISAVGQLAAYPKSKGVVTDYAGKLSLVQIEELTSIIETYKQQTSIEFAVVVVNSLEGESAHEYAIGVGDAWGIGQAGRNNGIILLWAPNERKYSLRIADGLSGDISNEEAKRITDENLLPYFKEEEYYAGLKNTVLATMQKLGGKSWEERMQARAQAAQQSREEQRLIIWSVAGGVTFVVLAVVIGVVLYRSRQRKQKLAEMDEARTAITENLRKARENAPKIQQLLIDLRQQVPEQDTGEISKELDGQPRRITSIQSDAEGTDFTDLLLYDVALRIRDSAEDEGSLLARVQERIADIKRAKERSKTLMEQLSQQKFEISDVRDSSKRDEVDRLLFSSRQMYQQACQGSSLSFFDWLLIEDLLNRSNNQVRQAEDASQAVPYVPTFSSSDNNSSSSSSFFDSSSSGGDFGGGGGFSSGSGSDGSY